MKTNKFSKVVELSNRVKGSCGNCFIYMPEYVYLENGTHKSGPLKGKLIYYRINRTNAVTVKGVDPKKSVFVRVDRMGRICYCPEFPQLLGRQFVSEMENIHNMLQDD